MYTKLPDNYIRIFYLEQNLKIIFTGPYLNQNQNVLYLHLPRQSKGQNRLKLYMGNISTSEPKKRVKFNQV